MSARTETQIQRLCAEALTVRTKADVERIMPELRAALLEHISLAKDTLGAQAKTLGLLNGLAGEDSPKL